MWKFVSGVNIRETLLLGKQKKKKQKKNSHKKSINKNLEKICLRKAYRYSVKFMKSPIKEQHHWPPDVNQK